MNFSLIYKDKKGKYSEKIYSIEQLVQGIPKTKKTLLAIRESSGFLSSNGEEIFEHDLVTIITEDSQLISVECIKGEFERIDNPQSPLYVSGAVLVSVSVSGFYFFRTDGLKSLPIKENYLGKHDCDCMVKVNNTVIINDYLKKEKV